MLITCTTLKLINTEVSINYKIHTKLKKIIIFNSNILRITYPTIYETK